MSINKQSYQTEVRSSNLEKIVALAEIIPIYTVIPSPIPNPQKFISPCHTIDDLTGWILTPEQNEAIVKAVVEGEGGLEEDDGG